MQRSTLLLTGKQKAGFLSIAICSMLLLAFASLEMAQGNYSLCVVLFIVSFCSVGFGFMMRKRFKK